MIESAPFWLTHNRGQRIEKRCLTVANRHVCRRCAAIAMGAPIGIAIALSYPIALPTTTIGLSCVGLISYLQMRLEGSGRVAYRAAFTIASGLALGALAQCLVLTLARGAM